MQIRNVRFIIAAITTLSAYAVYVSRVNLSIAIIAMVDDSHLHATSPSLINSTNQLSPHNRTVDEAQLTAIKSNLIDQSDQTGSQDGQKTPDHDNRYGLGSNLKENDTRLLPNHRVGSDTPHRAPLSTIFPASKKSMFRAPLISQEKFNWDQTAQGHILGAFFYGYILFQIPGARMAERVGARWILMVSTAGSALISLIFPMSTQLNSIHLLMVLRFVMGLCQSAFFPAAYVYFCRWLPESERSVLLPIMFIGSNLGSISTYIMSSYLISSSYGWPSVFYVSGLICLIVTVLWLVFGSNGPENNWLITDEERKYIAANINNLRDDPIRESESQQQQASLLTKSCCSTTAMCNANLIKDSKEILNLNNLDSAKKQDWPRMSRQISQIQRLHSKLNKSKSANDLIPAETAAILLEQQRQIISNHSSKPIIMVDLNNNNTNTNNDKQLEQTSQASQKSELSWTKILTSVPVWTLILSMYGNEWSQVVLTYELPTYLNTALKLPIEQNGVINSFFQLSFLLASPIMSSLGAYILDRHVLNMRKIHVRKLFQSLATFGQMACFISVPICGPNEGLIIMFMFSAIVFKSCANAGDIMVPGDLSPEFAGTIFAFANSIGNTAGVIVPLLAGLIVRDTYKREHWTPFWLTSASIMGCSGLIFLIFGKTNRQNFSKDQDSDEIGELEEALNTRKVVDGTIKEASISRKNKL